MKKIILILFLILGNICFSSAQNNPVLYQKFNDVSYGNLQNSTFIHFSVYITREVIDDPVYRYRYNIVVVNHSMYKDTASQLYMSGTRAFANGFSISDAYPSGFWAIIPFEENTVIYWYKTNETKLNFKLTWENIQHY